MSVWMQAALEALHYGEYARFRRDILPRAPFVVPPCLIREFEFGERRCVNHKVDPLFPIRFLWTLEGNEQRLYHLPAQGRSRYHPERLLEVWTRASTDDAYRQGLEADGLAFDLTERAVRTSAGWVYIGEQFVEDFLEIETAVRVELLFPTETEGELQPAFQEIKRRRADEAARPIG
jgi:hypothetical protein